MLEIKVKKASGSNSGRNPNAGKDVNESIKAIMGRTANPAILRNGCTKGCAIARAEKKVIRPSSMNKSYTESSAGNFLALSLLIQNAIQVTIGFHQSPENHLGIL
jgi:hypothetical protein